MDTIFMKCENSKLLNVLINQLTDQTDLRIG